MKLEVHDIGHRQPTICMMTSETPHGSGTCQPIAVFEDSDDARAAARLIDDLLDAINDIHERDPQPRPA